jgi:FKBP-type peptidyl-prolyl cis-trans isomerase SlyD
MRDGKFDSENVKVGAIIPLSDGQQTFHAVVKRIGEENVKVDLNHPLAGEDLIFRGTVLETRPATDEEIDSVLHPKCNGCNSKGSCCDNEGGCCGNGNCE